MGLTQHLDMFTGKYKTWTPGPWTPSVDRVHHNMDRVLGPPNHGPGPWTLYFYKLRLHHKLRFDDL